VRVAQPTSRESYVPYTASYYSVASTDPAVYHDKSNCPDGERIKPENKRYGTDNRRHCEECPKVS
jgi:hypothetical protein